MFNSNNYFHNNKFKASSNFRFISTYHYNNIANLRTKNVVNIVVNCEQFQ